MYVINDGPDIWGEVPGTSMEALKEAREKAVTAILTRTRLLDIAKLYDQEDEKRRIWHILKSTEGMTKMHAVIMLRAVFNLSIKQATLLYEEQLCWSIELKAGAEE